MMEKTWTVSVVIPTLNEAANLPHVLPGLPDIVNEVIVVDGGSTDHTIAVARELRSDIHIVRQSGRGKGDALQEGFRVASGDIIVMMDADGSHDPQEILLFVDELLKGADIAKGSRYCGDGGSTDFTFVRGIGNAGLSLLTKTLFGVQFTDVCYGYIAFWRRCLADLSLDCSGFEVEMLMNLRASKANLRIKEVPSFESPRLYGESKLHAIRDGWRILKTILDERL